MGTQFKRSVLSAAVALMLAACGGGGSTDGTPVAPNALTLSGTAATGAAIANAPVAAKCATGSGTATTAANGSYTIAITGGSLPCVIEVRPTSGGALRSVIDGSGSGSVSVNITPLTELIAAHLAGGAPADLFTTFDAAAQAKLGTPAVNAAIAAIVAALQGVVDIAGMNPIKDTLVIGNPLDQKLDALQAALAAAQTTLAEVVAAVATSGASTAPVSTLLKPAAASCAGFRSGKYRVLNPHEVGHDAAYVAHLITVDAATLKVTDDLDATRTQQTITPDAASPCKFTIPGDFGLATVLVSRSGLSVVLSPASTGQLRTSIVVPEQALPVSDLAGTWNVLGYGHQTLGSALAPLAATLTVDSTGNVTARSECAGLSACTALAPPLGSFVANPAGGFNLGAGRVFAFKTATGKVSLYLVDTETGSMAVATRQAALALPVVGDVTNFWDFSAGSNGVASTPIATTVTVKTVDAAAARFTRQRASDGRIDGFAINTPRAGLRYRAAGTSATTSGGSVGFSEIVVMPLADTGISVYTSVAATQSFFGVSVGKP